MSNRDRNRYPIRPMGLHDEPLVSTKEIAAFGGCFFIFLIIKLAFILGLIGGALFLLRLFGVI